MQRLENEEPTLLSISDATRIKIALCVAASQATCDSPSGGGLQTLAAELITAFKAVNVATSSSTL